MISARRHVEPLGSIAAAFVLGEGMVLADGFQLGDAHGRIIISSEGVETAVRQAQDTFDRGLSEIGSSLSRFGDSVSRIGQSMTLLTAPFSGGIVAGIRAAADFEASMNQISARTGLVGEDLQRIGEFAIQMGADTVFSSQQAAEAFLQLLSSGQSAEEAIATLPAVLNLAAASGDDLGRTADVVTDIMAAYGLSIDQASSVTDSLARAAASSSADVSLLGQGFANVGGVARQFGLDVDQTAAILAIFSENGVKGAEAGTQLRSMLLNMARDTPEVRAAWAELGTSMFDAEGNMRDFGVVMEEIRVAMQDMSPEEQTRLMHDLAGSYGIAGLAALTAGMSIEEMQEMMAGQADAAAIAQTQMDSFNNTIGSLIGSLEALAITVLTPFIEDTLKPAANELINVVNGIREWAEANPELASTILRIVAAVSVLGPILFIAGTAISAIGTVVGGAIAAITFLLSPIGLLIAGVALLALAWATNWNGIRDKVQEVAGAISAAVNTTIAPALDTLKTNIETAVNNAGVSLDFSTLETNVTTSLASALTNIQNAQVDLTPVTTWADENATLILDAVVSTVGIVFGGPIGAVIGAARLISAAIENDFLGFGTFIEQSGIGAAVQSGVDALRGIIEQAFQSLFGGGGAGVDAGQALAEEFASGMAVQATTQQSPIIETINRLVNGLISGVQSFGPEIQESLDQIANGVRGFIEALGGAETAGLVPLVETIVNGVLNAIGVVGSIIGIIMGLGIDIITDIFENVFPRIGEGMAAFISLLSAIGEGDPGAMLQAIADSLGAFIGAITGAVAGFADPLITAINDLTGGNLPLLSGIFNGIADAIQAVWDKVVEAVQPTIDEIQRLVDWFFDEEGGLTSVVTWINETFILAIASIQSVLSGIWDAVRGPLETFKNELDRIFSWIEEHIIRPVADAIRDVQNALASLSGQAPGTTVSVTAPPNFDAQFGQIHDYPGPAYAGVPYRIGTEEIFIPKDDGYITPLGGAQVGNTYQISVMMPEAALENPDRAREIGHSFGQGILEELDRL